MSKKKKQMAIILLLCAILIGLLELYVVRVYVRPKEETPPPPPPPPEGTELITNGGFELGTTPWEFDICGPYDGNFELSTDAYSGSYSGKVTSSGFDTEGWITLLQHISPEVGVTYTLKFMYKSTQSFGVYVIAYNADWTTAYWFEETAEFATPTNVWTEATLTVGPIPRVRYIWLDFSYLGTTLGSFQIDDVSVRG